MIACIGDPHGVGEEFNKLCVMLKAAGYDDLFCVGDLFDRAPEAYTIWWTIHNMNVKCVMGNHERKMLQFLLGEREHLPPHYYYALNDLRIHNVPKKEVTAFIKTLPLNICIKTSLNDVVIAHAGVDPQNPTKDSVSWNVYGNDGNTGWKHEPQIVGMGADADEGIQHWWDTYDSNGSGEDGPFIIYGHLSQAPPHGHEPRRRQHSMGIDTCACHGGPLTAYSPDNETIITYRSGIDHTAEVKAKLREWGKETCERVRKELQQEW